MGWWLININPQLNTMRLGCLIFSTLSISPLLLSIILFNSDSSLWLSPKKRFFKLGRLIFAYDLRKLRDDFWAAILSKIAKFYLLVCWRLTLLCLSSKFDFQLLTSSAEGIPKLIVLLKWLLLVEVTLELSKYWVAARKGLPWSLRNLN